ncbi:hypothetical protein [uncultured Megamonas sp.]|uniref:hypothetical protein n=1 Tax=uncultured Megamonas sp. TaxID=286140 RepID=UPI00259BE2DC|nr:hypothetical protein [uncultured Megamonas sp.]
MSLIIWDIESYIYKACSASTVFQQCKTDPYIYGEYYDLRKGIDFLEETAQRLRDTLLINDITYVVGDKENWRKKLNPEYKSNRKTKPPMYDVIKQWLLKNKEVVSLPNLEADDTARIIYEDYQNYPCRKVIVSIDKDFYSVPCEFYRDLHNNKDIEVISEEDAQKHLIRQIIMGDKTDGYNGIPGCGDKFCDEFITDKTTLGDVLELYKEKGLTPQDYLINKAMATIVSIKEYNFNTGKVVLK